MLKSFALGLAVIMTAIFVVPQNASASAFNGKLYFSDATYTKEVGERGRYCPAWGVTSPYYWGQNC